MGETRVNLAHLLEDLRDAYPGSLEETIVSEMVANALDSGARTVALTTDATAATLTVSDDGKGMTRAALTRYHDLAATSKRRGRSIGFAGVGVKLGLLLSEDVVTESRGRRTHLATSWRLTSQNRAPWRWVEPLGMVDPEAPDADERATGTAVRLYLSNALSPLLDRGFLDRVVTEHFQPLLDQAFDEILAGPYPEGVRFRINGREIPRTAPRPDRVPLRVRVGRQRMASGVGYMVRGPGSEEAEGGLAVSTMGKVILRGWD